jgi:hypothetical protein
MAFAQLAQPLRQWSFKSQVEGICRTYRDGTRPRCSSSPLVRIEGGQTKGCLGMRVRRLQTRLSDEGHLLDVEALQGCHGWSVVWAVACVSRLRSTPGWGYSRALALTQVPTVLLTIRVHVIVVLHLWRTNAAGDVVSGSAWKTTAVIENIPQHHFLRL